MDEQNGTMSLEEALKALERIAPGAPLLALGQTVFWDEPMKAGVALAIERLGLTRTFLAGVHDTDYFARAPYGQRQPGKFKALPHNDTTTKGLWSAAGEFSAMFGSETVVTRETLAHAGLRVEALERVRAGFLDEATEAWGWRGVCSLDEHPPVTAHVPLKQVWPELNATFDWALDLSLECLTGQAREEADRVADGIRSALCDARERNRASSMSAFYKDLLPYFYQLVAGRELSIESTTTTELLRFNTLTCDLPRFHLLGPFLAPESRERASGCYDSAVEGSGLYELARFGTGAIPFDLVIPGHGRGTIRIGAQAVVIETPSPVFLTPQSPITSAHDLAAAVEAKFGTECALVGKAVTLIGMLAREFLFVFHEGASQYVVRSRELHRRLAEIGHVPPLNPILRVRYSAWDALRSSCVWLRLPEPFRRPFGAEDVCSPSLATSWRTVMGEQEELLEELARLRKPSELIAFLDSHEGGSWSQVASEYLQIQATLAELEGRVSNVRDERRSLYPELRRLRRERTAAELAKGAHFRRHVFEKKASEKELSERQKLSEAVDAAVHKIIEVEHKIRDLRKEQASLVSAPEIQRLHARRRDLELEAEFKRLRLIRQAVISSKGLLNAGQRPSAWWFPLVCPDALWFRETVDNARCYLEEL